MTERNSPAKINQAATGDPLDKPVLTIDDLTVAYRVGGRWLDAVRDFTLRLAPGSTYGLVGESGSGKSTVALTIMRYLGPSGKVRQGRILFDGRDLLALSENDMRAVWGAQLALVPQDPLSALNPAIRVGEQLAEPLRQHMGLSGDAVDRRVLELLTMVRVPDPERVAGSYPHQISGGMQQRVMIAMALSTEPKLLILDEPTTALDVTTQATILDLLRELIRGRQTAALYVTHNLGVVARICDWVAVLYAGELVEDGPTGDLFKRPLHPYTRGLLDSVPRLGDNKRSLQLRAIPGRIPSLRERPEGCAFAPRCPLAIDICQERPGLEPSNDGRQVRCHRWPEIASGEVDFVPSESDAQASAVAQKKEDAKSPVLELRDLQVYFDVRRSLAEVIGRRPEKQVKAVDGVDLAIPPGKTLGLVGESGSGKTSLARAVIGLEEASDGEMRLVEKPLPSGLSRRDLETMSRLQIVFQNPEDALNPYMTVGETLRRPLMTLRKMTREEADTLVPRLLADVRLPAAYARRRPSQLSGGEKQRVAIARAFAANPDLLLADEPVSSLDVSVQASILNLLSALQSEHGTSDLFISHDLAVVGYLADEIAVIYAGQLMEVSPAEALFAPPHHPYTEALLSAIPLIDPDVEQEPIRLEGDVPNQIDIPSGCPFHPRCPRYLGDICANKRPPWRETGDGKRIFCHIALEELEERQAG
ncbi:MAG: ABC transporter ATP-binding protein [Chloroflexota bacterium]|jgi:peptide/nickel transport system ATP-binding protein